MIKEALDELKNKTKFATSSGEPKRFRGTFSSIILLTLSLSFFFLISHVLSGNNIFPGATTLTLISGANLYDKDFEKDISADLAVL